MGTPLWERTKNDFLPLPCRPSKIQDSNLTVLIVSLYPEGALMGFLRKAVRYTVPKVSVNQKGVRFGNHFGGVSSSWSGKPRADFGVGHVRARFGSGSYQGGRISSSSPGVSPTQEYVDLSGTRAPVFSARERRERPGFESMKKYGVIGLFPQAFHQHVATLFVYAGLFSSFLFTAITRFFAREYYVQDELWMDDKISSFLPGVLGFLCLCFFIFSLISFLISHLPVIAYTESVKWKRIAHSVVLTFFDSYIFFSVFTKPNSAQKVFNFDLSGDGLGFNRILIFPISAICLFITMQSLVRSLEPKEKTENRDAKNRILIQEHQQFKAEIRLAREAAFHYLRVGSFHRKGGRIHELNQQIHWKNDRTVRRVMQKTEWVEWMEWTKMQAVARLSAKAQFEEDADAITEAAYRFFLKYPEVPTSQTTIDSARMNILNMTCEELSQMLKLTYRKVKGFCRKSKSGTIRVD